MIRAFNENLSYSDFVIYQLAGDLYPSPTYDQYVASGFNRMHLIIDVGTAIPEESYTKNVMDRVAAVGTVFMGLTLQCATCHDHKYDPITQKDFYALFAFFNNIDAKPETISRKGPPNGLQPPFIKVPTPAEAETLATYNASLQTVNNALAKAPNDQALLTKQKTLHDQKKKLTANYSLKAMVTKERKEIRPAYMLIRGQYDKPGEEVTRNTPTFLPALTTRGKTPSRMDLAKWFVDPKNPLTARVEVNRIWQQFFGVGLVKTSEDFGSQGDVPSHPKLLDHLVVTFVESGWDVKKLVRQIVLSKAYRQASELSAHTLKVDAENRFIARGSRYRMDAEMIRDQVLLTSGLLNPTLYGKSVKPPQPPGLWEAVSMISEVYVASKGDDIYRRSLYTHWKRGLPPPQMTIMNAPSRETCIARRERTNTPLQALLLLNEPEYMKAARTLAQQTLGLKNLSTEQRMHHVYETITSQRADAQEQKILVTLLDDIRAYYTASPSLASTLCKGANIAPAEETSLAAWTVVVNAIYNLDVTKTRE